MWEFGGRGRIRKTFGWREGEGEVVMGMNVLVRARVLQKDAKSRVIVLKINIFLNFYGFYV